jgi:hypothetical protein
MSQFLFEHGALAANDSSIVVKMHSSRAYVRQIALNLKSIKAEAQNDRAKVSAAQAAHECH